MIAIGDDDFVSQRDQSCPTSTSSRVIAERGHCAVVIRIKRLMLRTDKAVIGGGATFDALVPGFRPTLPRP